MKEKVLKTIKVIFYIHCIFGLIFSVGLIFLPEISIGEGRFDQVVTFLEKLNFKWWIVLMGFVIWAIPIAIAFAYFKAQDSILRFDQLKDSFIKLMEDRKIPVQVNIDNNIPINFKEAFDVPVVVDTKMDINEKVEVDTEVPIKCNVPIETNIETKVLGIGKVEIPIKSTVPIDIVLPFKGFVEMKVKDFPVSFKEKAQIEMPPMNVPIKCNIETQIDLMSNWEKMESYIKEKKSSFKGFL